MIVPFLLISVGLMVAAVLYRPVAAYAMVGFAPFVVAFSRGDLFPQLRPNEALLAMMWVATVVGWWYRRERPEFGLNTVDIATIGLVLFGSVVPLLVSIGRLRPIGLDGVLYSFALWRLLALYFLVRLTVRTSKELTTLLTVAVVAAGIVGLAVLADGMNLAGAAYRFDPYFPIDEGPIDDGRGAATIGNAIGAGVYSALGLLVGVSLLLKGAGRRSLLVAGSVGCLIGVFGSGQVTGILALGVGAVALGLASGRATTMIRVGIPVVILVAVLALPLIQRRVDGFDSSLTSQQRREISELPGPAQPGAASEIDPGSSWDVRVYNLEHYFLPSFSDPTNVLVGVSALPRADADEVYRDYVWIESGYVWLLWIGGIPLVLAFSVFSWHAARSTWAIARSATGPAAAAGAAGFAAVVVLVAVQALDPHLTLRGTADLFFPILAASLMASSGRPLVPASRELEAAA